MTDHALVCVFTHPDGRSRPLGVTRPASKGGRFVLLYKGDGKSNVIAYATVGACDAEFMAVIEYWALEGFEFNRSVEIPVPPFGASGVTEKWADGVLDSVVIPVRKRSIRV